MQLISFLPERFRESTLILRNNTRISHGIKYVRILLITIQHIRGHKSRRQLVSTQIYQYTDQISR